MEKQAWVEQMLSNLDACGDEGVQAVHYLRNKRVKIGFWKQKATGAMWFIDGNIYLNAHVYSIEKTRPDDPFMLSLVAHEACHLRQGFFTALSVFGELEAWQFGFRVYTAAGRQAGHSALVKLLSLPLGMERDTLQLARVLMKEYAGPHYRIDLLPLYPLGKELHWRMRG